MAALVVAGCALAAPAATSAATFTVSTNADAGAGSLRAAIDGANAAGTDDDIVVNPATGELVLASPLPAVTDNVAIDLTGLTINAMDQDQTNGGVLFFSGAGANGSSLRDATISNFQYAAGNVSQSATTVDFIANMIDAAGADFGLRAGSGATGVEFRDNTITGGNIGINAVATGPVIDGNTVGAAATGLVVTGASAVIDGNTVNGNGVGANITGSQATLTGNTVASNTADGITLGGFGSTLTGNRVGTNAAGADLGNGGDGLDITGGVGHQVGTAAMPNMFAFNAGAGIHVSTGTGNFFRVNAFAGNDLDNILLGAANAPNDTLDLDSGPNDTMNAPVITSASPTEVKGTINTRANQTVEIHCVVLGGSLTDFRFVGATTGTTNASGDFAFTIPINPPLDLGELVECTASIPDGTGPFSARVATSAPATTGTPPATTGGGGGALGPSGFAQPPFDGPAPACTCKQLTVKLDPTLLNKKGLRPDKHNFGVGITWFLTCNAGKGGCLGTMTFKPPRILEGTRPKPKNGLQLKIQNATLVCNGPCTGSSTGRFEIKMLSRGQLKRMFGQTLAYTVETVCGGVTTQQSVRVFVDDKGVLRDKPPKKKRKKAKRRKRTPR